MSANATEGCTQGIHNLPQAAPLLPAPVGAETSMAGGPAIRRGEELIYFVDTGSSHSTFTHPAIFPPASLNFFP